MTRRLPRRRSDCGISCALDFVGDRWTLLVLRDLIMARKRYFREMLASPEGIASNILASRLRQLESAGMVTRRADPHHKRQVIYAPTGKALDLLPSMLELMRWSVKWNAKSGGPAPILRRVMKDRDGFVAEMRALHLAAK